ncbi:S-adenosyl-L-methionine-dependent methyltransferase [Parachaetomium inaequale]|uniref:S-adenosyl-L-methionine-dependent methyltransferase n=1 Tax=Parachaetomium inaequale TaxID=2588326 RepID=A0AAN6SNT3_9PEZI|nr:S-adenosyl-L-methionine-dependent methyltransferase [Parachaetomium inaequale]
MTTPHPTADTPAYAPGHAASQTKHHEWRTAQNSAAHLLPHLDRLAQQTPHLKLLDVGAGSGTISASLAAHLLPHGGSVLATDISDAILSRAASHATSQNLPNITFQRASVYALPFPDGEFHVVHAHQVLCHLPDPAAAIREMLRVCAPGGVVALRESDMRMWCVWPEREALLKFHGLMVDTLVANGGQDKGGRRLVSWVLDAGAGSLGRGDVEAGFGTWCYSEEGDRRAWGEAMVERLRTGQMREKGIELGLTTEEGIEEMIKAWEGWIETDDATLGIMNGEVIVKKP